MGVLQWSAVRWAVKHQGARLGWRQHVSDVIGLAPPWSEAGAHALGEPYHGHVSPVYIMFAGAAGARFRAGQSGAVMPVRDGAPIAACSS